MWYTIGISDSLSVQPNVPSLNRCPWRSWVRLLVSWSWCRIFNLATGDNPVILDISLTECPQATISSRIGCWILISTIATLISDGHLHCQQQNFIRGSWDLIIAIIIIIIIIFIIIGIIIINIITMFIHLFIVMGHQLKVRQIPNSYVAKWHNWWAVFMAFLYRKWSVINLMLQSRQGSSDWITTLAEGGSTALICLSEGYPPASMTFQKAGKLPYANGANVSYHQLSNIRNTKSHNLNVFLLVLQLSLPNPFHSSRDPWERITSTCTI